MQDNLFDDLPAGVKILRNFISIEDQAKLVAKCREIAGRAPLVRPQTKSGFNFSLSVTSVGRWGWFSDPVNGYHYRRTHPVTKQPWEKIPRHFLKIAKTAALEIDYIYQPDTCLINYYPPGTGRLGLHQDNTEEDLKTPIITFSLGESCRFLIGGPERKDKCVRTVLHSGDVMIMHGAGRMLFHGVEALIPGNGGLLKQGGRISLTFRRHKPIEEEKINASFRRPSGFPARAA